MLCVGGVHSDTVTRSPGSRIFVDPEPRPDPEPEPDPAAWSIELRMELWILGRCWYAAERVEAEDGLIGLVAGAVDDDGGRPGKDSEIFDPAFVEKPALEPKRPV